MSQLIVDVCRIKEIKPHGNADRLEIATFENKGWQCIVGKAEFKVDDLCVYFPPDAFITQEFGNRFGVYNYTHHGRVKAIRLRGEPSYGFCIPIERFSELKDANVGDNVAEKLGITKYEPPVDTRTGKPRFEHVLLHRYTNIESYGNFPNLIEDDEVVIATEKIHGANSRVALIEDEFMAGSHRLQRIQPEDGDYAKDLYWYPLAVEGVQEMLEHVYKEKKAKAVILFGEIYGNVQKLKYGRPNSIAYVAYDISVDGKYLNWHEFAGLMEKFRIPMVPIIGIPSQFIEYKKHDLNKIASGNTYITDPKGNPLKQIREGIVIKPVIERRHHKEGRVILKHKNVAYLGGNYE